MPLSPFANLAPPVVLRNISVRFGEVMALDVVDLDLAPGLRHAVVGENGAGKSTLMKVLFGQVRPQTGQILIGGQEKNLASPADAIRQGVGMVHQHFELIGAFTAAENVVLGAEPTRRGPLLDRKQAEDTVRRLADENGLSLDPTVRVDELSVASQQRVEILKALYRRARVLILDEPTAVLAPSEAQGLWEATRKLSEAGTTVVFITHKLDEVMAHADTVTVLRKGRRVFASNVADTNPAELADAMVGSGPLPPAPFPITMGKGEPVNGDVVQGEGLNTSTFAEGSTATASPFPIPMGKGAGGRGPVLSVQNLTVKGRRGEAAVRAVSLDLYAGEIVGLAGVDGSGQIELIEALLGLRATAGGILNLDNSDITSLSTAQRRTAGMGYVPEDRQHRAVILPFSCEENAVLGRVREPAFAGRSGLLRQNAIREFLTERIAAFDVRGARVGLPIKSLSGGNQQKLVLARELSRRPKVLLASQPTRGLDFAASAFVHNALRAERDRGAAVLVQSLDLAEVLALSDRVAVLLAGKIVGVVSGSDATEAKIGAMMTGAEAAL